MYSKLQKERPQRDLLPSPILFLIGYVLCSLVLVECPCDIDLRPDGSEILTAGYGVFSGTLVR